VLVCYPRERIKTTPGSAGKHYTFHTRPPFRRPIRTTGRFSTRLHYRFEETLSQVPNLSNDFLRRVQSLHRVPDRDPPAALSPLRQYYSARNCIHISRRYGTRFPLLILINIITMQQILSVAPYEKDKRKKIVAMMAGIIDGLRGRYGRFETCRPRTFAFCIK